ncbi:MAG: YgjV family protein [Defluviitaleaceae bacterium]|nr:YgjV family protein [Defluviitaleaceae bacterium]
MIEFFSDSFNRIVNVHIYETTWWLSQFFAFLSLIVMFWSFQIKDKLKMMLLLGLGTTFLAVSAIFLANWTLTVLFMLASVRNYVFCYLEWIQLRGRMVPKWIKSEKLQAWGDYPSKVVPKWVWYSFGALFITLTIASTVILVHIVQVEVSGIWVEWFICVTLIGLIIGNVTPGTHLMRISFVANRAFNIINHAFFGNAIAVIIACLTISSNIIFYVRQLVGWLKGRNKKEEEAQTPPVADEDAE